MDVWFCIVNIVEPKVHEFEVSAGVCLQQSSEHTYNTISHYLEVGTRLHSQLCFFEKVSIAI